MHIIVEKEKGIATLKLHRPDALNALNRSLVDELDHHLDALRNDKEMGAVILTGEKNFAAGADIKAMVDLDAARAEAFAFSKTFQKIYDLEIPTIAAIEGYALGGGLELAITCDFRIASSEAKLGFPETGLGIMPGAGGTIIAPRLIGVSKALEMILFGSIIDAEEALHIGLVNRITEPGQAYKEALLWADKLVNGAPLALKMVKKTIREGLKAGDYETGMEIEKKNWAMLFETLDQKEGMTAFLEKRKPVYKGK
jgi:enoyl-CoA hydratase/carnithine racemase